MSKNVTRRTDVPLRTLLQEQRQCALPGTLRRQRLAIRSRLGELHRLLNNRKGSLSATHRKNAKANDRAYDMNQKIIQALDTLAEEFSASEAPMKKVTFEHEEEIFFAVASEVADELGPGPSARRTGLLMRRHGDRYQGVLQLLGCARSGNLKNKKRF